MLGVRKIFRPGKTTAQVVLTNNQLALVPMPVDYNTVYDESDIVIVESSDGIRSWAHVSLVQQKPVKDPAPESAMRRGWEGYDAEAELTLIRNCIVSLQYEVFGRSLDPESLKDLTSACFLKFWERKLYRRFDGDSYIAYFRTSVYNFMIDYRRGSACKVEEASVSLFCKVGDEDSELVSLLEDTSCVDVVEKLEREALEDKFKAQVVQLDKLEPTGLSRLTYKKLFDYLLSGMNVLDIRSLTRYSKKTIEFYMGKLRGRLEACAQPAA